MSRFRHWSPLSPFNRCIARMEAPEGFSKSVLAGLGALEASFLFAFLRLSGHVGSEDVK